MKTKLFFLTAGIIFLSCSVNAQNVLWGIKGGANFSTVNANTTGGDWGSRMGIHAGLLAHIHLNKNWAIQPELMYSAQGAKNTPTGGTAQVINLHYLNMPVLVQYMFNNGFRLQTGPQVGFLLSANNEVGDTHETRTDLYNKADFGWAFGGGYLTDSGLGIDARYNLGLTDIYKPGDTKQTNGVFQLGLFYMFNHRSK